MTGWETIALAGMVPANTALTIFGQWLNSRGRNRINQKIDAVTTTAEATKTTVEDTKAVVDHVHDQICPPEEPHP